VTSAEKYVTAAYLVVLGAVLLYVVIYAFKLARLEREVAALEPDGHGLTLLPLWAGERSPGWASDARGAIVGLRLHTGPAEIWRAALEAIALYFGRLHAILQAVVPEAREVIATGGALLPSPTWMQIMADVLGRPVLASAEPEASSRGAALLAFEALGALPGGIESLSPATARTYEPIPAHVERYRAAAERQARLYDFVTGAESTSSSRLRPTPGVRSPSPRLR
jgi:gluconokinase